SPTRFCTPSSSRRRASPPTRTAA
ncbi:MAG: hypothetical protein AVDCRST_MAG16-1000, partial [uncultured Frankineae bacterium]